MLILVVCVDSVQLACKGDMVGLVYQLCMQCWDLKMRGIVGFVSSGQVNLNEGVVILEREPNTMEYFIL